MSQDQSFEQAVVSKILGDLDPMAEAVAQRLGTGARPSSGLRSPQRRQLSSSGTVSDWESVCR